LPYHVGIYQVNLTGRDLIPETSSRLQVGPAMTLSADLAAGVYVYGLVTPIPYVYDPDGQSTWMTGSQTGNVQALWGILWVDP
jgi:hypothetical protein